MKNFTTHEASTNFTTQPLPVLDISMYSICFLLGLPAHSYVTWLIATGSGVESEFFNLNFSVCEIGISLAALLGALSFLSPSLTTILQFLQGLLVTGSPLFQSLICVERYLAVVHPVTFLKSKPLRYRLICCSVVWVITLASCLVCMIISKSYHAFVWFFSTEFILFFSIQLFCLVAVLRALKQSGPGDRKREEENHMKRKAFQIILITTVSITCAFVPFIIIGFSYVLTMHFVKGLFAFSFACFYPAGFVQPVLYLQRAGKLSRFCTIKH